MTTIRQQDSIGSIAAALQFISYCHQRVNLDTLARREKLWPGVDFTNHFIYHVDPERDEVVGFTTATRMDNFTETMLAEIGMGAICEFEVENMPVTVDAQGR